MDWRDYVGPVHEAACAIGLAPRETQFFELPPADLNALAAYGLPGMYHHWRFGRDYFRIRQSHERGWSQLYEVVFNLDPAQAFVSSQGSEAAKVFVVAHVMGHVDLFEQNLFCAEQRTDMDRFLLSAQRRFDRYEELYGEEAVEHTFDVAHMLRQHVRPGRARHSHDESTERRPYDDLFGASPPATPMEAERRRRLEREYESTDIGQDDLLAFMAAQAPLEPWQRDVLMCVREVALYFRPQMLTKVVHEGYASWSHLRILRELELPFEWAIEHAKMHAGVARPHEQGAPNPYWLGLLLLEHAEHKGRNVRETVGVDLPPGAARPDGRQTDLLRLQHQVVDRPQLV
ncbi:MAG TPA: SpoVR family protein [Limnochordia bacterium]|nr:SpoVR family protein [Limnochordia bacterium]